MDRRQQISPFTSERLAHYRIVAKIGAGGMGEVYRAHDDQLDREVAIKVLPAVSLDDPIARARLVREARAAAALNHPHICTVHEVGEAKSGFQVTRKLATRVAFSWQRSHGGLRSTEIASAEQVPQIDRLLRDNNFHIGGGAAYSLPRFDLFVAYTHYVSGTDTHAGRALTTGISWPFER